MVSKPPIETHSRMWGDGGTKARARRHAKKAGTDLIPPFAIEPQTIRRPAQGHPSLNE